MSLEVEALRDFYAAVDRNDIKTATKNFDPDIVRIEPEGFPTAGTYRGAAEVRKHISAGRDTWAEGTCLPEKFLVNKDKVVVYLHVSVRMKGAVNWTEGRFADGFVFRKGKIAEHRSFAERAQALEWAGIHNGEPS